MLLSGIMYFIWIHYFWSFFYFFTYIIFYCCFTIRLFVICFMYCSMWFWAKKRTCQIFCLFCICACVGVRIAISIIFSLLPLLRIFEEYVIVQLLARVLHAPFGVSSQVVDGLALVDFAFIAKAFRDFENELPHYGYAGCIV